MAMSAEPMSDGGLPFDDRSADGAEPQRKDRRNDGKNGRDGVWPW